jgi:iron-sulfur cluster repair protein YtfE (RIC family)
MELYANVPNFDQPIEALYICHENILKRMNFLDELSTELLRKGPSHFASQVEYWRDILSFMSHTLPIHARDEEEGLFPMIAADQRNDNDISPYLADHSWAVETEHWLKGQFEVFTSNEHPPSDAHMQLFAERGQALARFYRDHIAKENEFLFPMARTILTKEQVDRLGHLMRKHRKIEVEMPSA